MIGDTAFDMAMAVAAGVRPIGVAWGYHRAGALIAAGAAVVLPDIDALAGLLEGLLAPPGPDAPCAARGSLDLTATNPQREP